MSKPEICPTCGEPLEDVRPHAFLTLVLPENGTIAAEQRMITGECPKCGPRLTRRHHMGIHSTAVETQMDRLFGKRWKAIRDLLQDSDREKFVDAVHGRFHPTKDDLVRWLQIYADIANRPVL